MNLLANIILFVCSMFGYIPQDDTTIAIPEPTIIYMPIVLKSGDSAIVQLQETATNNLVPGEVIPEDLHCGYYADWGGHPCPQADNATPPANNNRINENRR